MGKHSRPSDNHPFILMALIIGVFTGLFWLGSSRTADDVPSTHVAAAQAAPPATTQHVAPRPAAPHPALSTGSGAAHTQATAQVPSRPHIVHKASAPRHTHAVKHVSHHSHGHHHHKHSHHRHHHRHHHGHHHHGHHHSHHRHHHCGG